MKSVARVYEEKDQAVTGSVEVESSVSGVVSVACVGEALLFVSIIVFASVAAGSIFSFYK